MTGLEDEKLEFNFVLGKANDPEGEMALMEIEAGDLGEMKLKYDDLNRATPYKTKLEFLSYDDESTNLTVKFKDAEQLSKFIGSTTFKIRLTDKQGVFKIYTLLFTVKKPSERTEALSKVKEHPKCEDSDLKMRIKKIDRQGRVEVSFS